MSGLPPGWTTAHIGELCTLVNGRAFKPSDWSTEGLPIIRIQNLNNPEAPFNRYSGEVDPRFFVSPGQLLFAWSGTPGTSFGAHIWSGGDAILNQHIFKVLFNEQAVTKRFFQLAINQKLEELIGEAHGGVGLAHVTKGKFEATEVLLPPLAEQHRIVARLEALFARSRAAKGSLERVPTMLERLRHSLLAAAFRGELTTEWRAQNPSVEDARALLLRLKGGTPGKARASAAPTREDDALPASWTWAPLRGLVQEKEGLLCDGDWVESKDQDPKGAVRLIQLADIGVGQFRDKSRRFLTEEMAKKLRCTFLSKADLLVSRMADPIGRACLFPGLSQPAVTVVDACIIRPGTADIDPRWLMHAINSPVIRASILQLASGSTRVRVSRSNLETVLLPVAPPQEQRAIARVLDHAFDRLDALERTFTQAKARLENLEKSALSEAFRGELVSQDPQDPPASVLLERLRAERGPSAPARSRGARKAS